jgi:hypothetical protein
MPEVLPSDEVVRSSEATPATSDLEKQPPSQAEIVNASKTSIFKSLGWLDRFLALWIFLAMAIGIILGNFVPNTGPALQKGKFVGVSVPIGKSFFLIFDDMDGADVESSYWVADYDVSYSL